MIRQKGMCSVTFRELTVEEIVGLTKASGLNCIEWGSDVHVPVGDLQNAKRVKALTEEQGLNIYSYGSYFRCNDVIEFEKVSKTAQELGAKIIRVWAGEKTQTSVATKILKNLFRRYKSAARLQSAEIKRLRLNIILIPTIKMPKIR